jgi:hypothetical protein
MRLPPVEGNSRFEISYILMIGIDYCSMLGSLKEMSPLCARKYYHYHFLIENIVLELNW